MFTYYTAGQSVEFTMTQQSSVRVESSGVTGTITITPLAGKAATIALRFPPFFTQLDDFDNGTIVKLLVDGGLGSCGLEVLGLVSAGGGGGGVSVPNRIPITAAKTIAASDLGNILDYDSASNADITISTDAVLGLSGVTNNSFEVYQKGNGVPNIIAGAGVTLTKWAGYPTSALGVTQFCHRVGANAWAVK